MSKFCTKCGAQLDDDARFCTNCGQVVDSIPVPSAEAPSETPEAAPDVPEALDAPFMQPESETPAPEAVQPEAYNTEDVPTGDPNWNPDTQTVPQAQWDQPQPTWQQPEGQQANMGGYPGYPQQPVKQKKKLSKGALIGIICGAVAVIAGAVVAILLLTGAKKVNLDNYISVDFSGYDSYGTASIDFDSYKFVEDNKKNFKKGEYASSETAASLFAMGLEYSADLDKDSGLKNGDKVKVTWTFSDTEKENLEKTYGIKLDYSEKEFTVEGLAEVKTFDPFDSLEVEFEGNDGHGYARLNQKDDDYYWAYGFESDSTYDLSNGDTITVTCDLYSDDESYFLSEYGALPETLTKVYTVEGLTEVTEFDPFEYITVEFTGISPEGEAEVVIDRDSLEVMGSVYVDTSYFYDLKNGDEITVELDDWYTDEDYAEYYAMVPSTRSKTYTVEGLPEYLTTLDQINDDVLNQMKASTEAALAEEAESYPEGVTASATNYLGLYMLLPSQEDQYYSQNNYVLLVYSVDLTDGEGGEATYYYYGGFENLIEEADGSVTLEDEEADTTYSTVMIGNSFYDGYASLDDFKESCITYNADSYNYVTNME